MRVDNYWKANSISKKLIDGLKNGDITLTRKLEFSEDKDLLKIHVYFLDLDYESIKEEPEYEMIDLMADVGGIMGKIQ